MDHNIKMLAEQSALKVLGYKKIFVFLIDPPTGHYEKGI